MPPTSLTYVENPKVAYNGALWGFQELNNTYFAKINNAKFYGYFYLDASGDEVYYKDTYDYKNLPSVKVNILKTIDYCNGERFQVNRACTKVLSGSSMLNGKILNGEDLVLTPIYSSAEDAYTKTNIKFKRCDKTVGLVWNHLIKKMPQISIGDGSKFSVFYSKIAELNQNDFWSDFFKIENEELSFTIVRAFF